MMRHPLPAFTLIEITITLGVLAILSTFIVPVGLNGLRYYSVQSEQSVIVGLLENVRSQSLVNTDEIAHGVAILSNSYVVFSGSSYAARNASRDITYPRASNLSITGGSEIVFNPLTGQTTATNLTIQNATSQKSIAINKEGTIDW
jgi:Tfp pilus assembly protein FimT